MSLDIDLRRQTEHGGRRQTMVAGLWLPALVTDGRGLHQLAASAAATGNTRLLANLVKVTAVQQAAIASRFNILPAVDLPVGLQSTDLTNVATRVQARVDDLRPKLPHGSQVVMRSPVEGTTGERAAKPAMAATTTTTVPWRPSRWPIKPAASPWPCAAAPQRPAP